jgi:metal-dependent amidase/aminoacylase/carboxypeptidase family protein
MNDELKRRAAAAIDQRRHQLVDLSQKIHDHPELGFAETRSVAWLVEACRELGWRAEAGLYELPTAWRAT